MTAPKSEYRLVLSLALCFVLAGCASPFQESPVKIRLAQKEKELIAITGVLYGQVSMEANLIGKSPAEKGALCKNLRAADHIRDEARSGGFEDSFVEDIEGVVKARAICADEAK